jgi:hypothetical protein
LHAPAWNKSRKVVTQESHEQGPVERPALLSRVLGGLHRIHKWVLIAAFAMAVIHWFLLREGSLGALPLFVLPPTFAMLVAGAPAVSKVMRGLAWSFLCCLGMGIVISEFSGILPGMKSAPGLPAAEGRMLGWYLMVYLAYVFVVWPPFLFVGQLMRRRRGDPKAFSRATCLAGLAAWLLMGSFTVRLIVETVVNKWLTPP